MRERAMKEAALAAFEAGAVAVSHIATTAGADAERARVVAWLRYCAEQLDGEAAVALMAAADAIERGAHWESGDGQR